MIFPGSFLGLGLAYSRQLGLTTPQLLALAMFEHSELLELGVVLTLALCTCPIKVFTQFQSLSVSAFPENPSYLSIL